MRIKSDDVTSRLSVVSICAYSQLTPLASKVKTPPMVWKLSQNIVNVDL